MCIQRPSNSTYWRAKWDGDDLEDMEESGNEDDYDDEDKCTASTEIEEYEKLEDSGIAELGPDQA